MSTKLYLPLLAFLGLLLTDVQAVAQTFSEVAVASNIDTFVDQKGRMGGGATFFDMDNDGDEDLFITGGYTDVQLFENDGAGSFTDVTSTMFDGIDAYTVGCIAGDIDNDGDKDLFITTWVAISDETILEPNYLYLNNGDGTFTDVSNSAGITHGSFSMASSFLDYDLDGYLDIYVGNYVESGNLLTEDLVCRPNYLYKNNGNLTFTEVAVSLGMDHRGCALAVTGMNYDQGAEAKIYIANDFGEYGWTYENTLFEDSGAGYVDNGPLRMADVAFYAMGIAGGDYDLDGDFDYYITNLGKNALLRNDGITFSRQEDFAGVGNEFALDPPGNTLTTGWGTGFADCDNDMYPDLFVTNGRVPTGDPVPPTGEIDPNKLYMNNKDGTFTDVSEAAGIDDRYRGRGLSYSDYDNDGDIDFFVPVQNRKIPEPGDVYQSKLYRNDLSNANNYLKITLQGTINNYDAIGAIARVHVGGKILTQEVYGGGPHCSMHSTILHFGLGTETSVDMVEVQWPGGNIQTQSDIGTNAIAANQHITIIEGLSPLPVELVEFTAEAGDDKIDLQWITASETDNAGFEIQRTTNPIQGFSAIDFVDAAGAGTYNFTDTEVIPGVRYYYRLRQVDTDGSHNFSKSASAVVEAGNKLEILKNPVRDNLPIIIPDGLKGQVRIYSASGKEVFLGEVGDSNIVQMDVSNFAAGMYIIRVGDGPEAQSGKFIKE